MFYSCHFFTLQSYPMKKIYSGPTEVVIGKNLLEKISEFLPSAEQKVLVITDKQIYSLWENSLNKSLPSAEVFFLPNGEQGKDLSYCADCWRYLVDKGFDRSSVIINFGGGSITDAGGFIASLFKRGISFINIPTTLLAMVDASVGGKTGVDFEGLKNEIGVFSNPKNVLIDINVLSTLDQRQIKSGFAEIIKHYLIVDAISWNQLAECKELIADSELVFNNVSIKNQIVLSDPFEKGERKKLNFGHTFGHAYESFLMSAKMDITHGEAVAAGIIVESWLSNKVHGLPQEELKRINRFILTHFRSSFIKDFNNELVLTFMKKDKKNNRGKINFTLIDKPGNAVIDNYISEPLIIEAMENFKTLI